MSYDVTENVTLSANYEYIHFGSGQFDKSLPAPLGITIVGEFDSHAHAMAFSVNWKFGKKLQEKKIKTEKHSEPPVIITTS